jgi:3-oxoacyl-[acyl-carrier protein] reductase
LANKFKVPIWMNRTEWLMARMLIAEQLEHPPEDVLSNRRFSGYDEQRIDTMRQAGWGGFARAVSRLPTGHVRMDDGQVIRVGQVVDTRTNPADWAQPLAGKKVLVTGASRGIGAAIALELARQGMRVVGTATSAAGAAHISAALSAYPGCRGEVLDVTDGPAGEALINVITQTEGSLHVLVNNAGITRDTLLMRMKDADWDAVIDANLKGVFRMTRAVSRTMMKQRYGRIVNITSVVGAMGNAGQANYAASKAGVAGMTRALARELGSRGITVNCVAPGFIETDMTAALSAEQQTALMAQIPAGRLGQAQEVAQLVAYLASPQAGYVSGQEIHINGGMHM